MAAMALRALGGLATSSAFVSGFKSTTGVVKRELRQGELAWRRRLVLQQQRRNHQAFRGSPVAMLQPSPDSSGERDLQPLGVVSSSAPSGEILETVYVEGVTMTSDSPGGLGPNAEPFLSTPDPSGLGAGFPMPPPVAGETIGQALETAALQRGDKELTTADARAVQSAESRATGQPTIKGGPGAVAQSMADKGVPMGEVLRVAAERLPVDKVVTQEDASAVQSAEQRNNEGRTEAGGVAASVQQAANFNKSIGVV